jgi:teichuronic acid biosynthesis glycosyltransferase TuaG
MKKILITGAGSFIGESVERYLTEYATDFHIVTLDMTEKLWEKFDFSGFDVIFHVAGIVHRKERASMKSLYQAVNRDLAYAVAKKAKQQGVRQFIFLSTMSVYGKKTGIITRETKPIPTTLYGISKLQAEQLLQTLSDDRFRIAILRPPMVYGRNCRGNYPKLARFALKYPFFPDFTNRRSMLHIDHLSELIRLLIRDSKGGTFFPQNPEYVNVSEMVRKIASIHDREIRSIRLFNPIIRIVRTSILHKLFGDLIYDESLSVYPNEYRLFDFTESILRTEREIFRDDHAGRPEVSVIMPAYNCQKTIRESIRSVREQSYKDWELIVVDDGSSDGTPNIVLDLCDQDERIVFHQNDQNRGVSATRNKGISLAQGDWIAFLDSDDCWEKDKLEKQLCRAAKKRAGFIFTGSSFINANGVPFSGIFEVPIRVTYKSLLKHNVISCSSVLIRKEYFKDIQMERDDMHEDFAVWLRILKTGVTAFGINEPLLIYRISSGSKSGNKLKTFRMTYRVYRFVGIHPIGSFYYTIRHILGSIRKYAKIKGVWRKNR